MPFPTNSAHSFNGVDEFHKLKPGTQLYVEQVYNTMIKLRPGNDPESSYFRLEKALSCLGVLPEYNPQDRTTPEILIAQRVHQQLKDAKIFTWYGDSDFDLSLLTRDAHGRNWNLDDLKIIAAKWMKGKDEELTLKLGKRLLSICEADYYSLVARQAASRGSHPMGTGRPAVSALRARKVIHRTSGQCIQGLEEEDCAICYESMTGNCIKAVGQCGHSFHQHCINPWLKGHQKCPYCRQSWA